MKFFLILFLFSCSVFAEQETPPPVPDSLSSPRATIGTFLNSMNDIKKGKAERIDDAISTLDLSEISPLIRNERGRDLAWMLLEIIDRTRVVGVSKLSNRTTGKPYVFKQYKAGSIIVSMVPDGRWLFNTNTIADLPAILDEISDKAKVKGNETESEYMPLSIRIRSKLPDNFKQQIFMLEYWQCIGICLIVILGVILDKLVSILLLWLVRNIRSKSKHEEFKNISGDILRPFGLMIMAIIWWIGLNVLGLQAEVLLILLVAVKFLACIAGVWAAYRLVDLLGAYLMIIAHSTASKLDDMLFPLIPRSLKIIVTIIGVVFIADSFNMDITGLLAGLGLGGLAFALAAKDMVQNLFGSITILLDRTFSVGDWIIVGDIEGTVESIGFRSTRIRTFYNSLKIVPNSRFITADVDNMGERTYRRLSCKLKLPYTTPPDKIEAFCEGVREIVRLHPYMRKDYYHIYLNQCSDSSLDVLVYVFWKTPDWATELRERHRFLLDVVRLANVMEIEFALPAQNIYMKQPEDNISSSMSPEAAILHGQTQAKTIVPNFQDKPLPVTFNE